MFFIWGLLVGEGNSGDFEVTREVVGERGSFRGWKEVFSVCCGLDLGGRLALGGWCMVCGLE